MTVFSNSVSEEVWRTKYRFGDEETVDDTFKRVATNLASIENNKEYWAEKFYSILEDFKFVPGGRITSNAGTNLGKTTYINCFVDGFGGQDQDSLEGIYSALSRQARILASEGGYGFNCDVMRPRGATIGGIGNQTPGAVKFLELWDKSSEIITAGSGKENKKGEKASIRKGAQMVVCSCLAGNTLIWTLEGKVPIKDLVGKNPYLYCTDGETPFVRQAEKVWSNGIKKTVRIKFDDDTHLDCTEDHLIMLSSTEYVQAKDLQYGDSVLTFHKRLYKSGYLHIGITGKRKMMAEHLAVCEMKYGRYPSATGHNRTKDMTIAHHIDENKINNLPENIELVTLDEHIKIHNYFKDALDKGREVASNNRRGKTHKEYYGEEKAKIIYDKVSKSRKGKKVWNKGLTGKSYTNHYKKGFKNQFSEPVATLPNHKVISVTYLCEQEVFDISVPDFHNFVANNVFVHNCWHPDIEEFVIAKQEKDRLTKFNMSVLCTDEFMNAVENDEPWELKFPNYEGYSYLYKQEWDGNIEKWERVVEEHRKNIDCGPPCIIYKTFKSARELWDLIMTSTYNRNEPGVLQGSIINRMNNLWYIEYLSSTNPCGEQPLPARYGICLLGSLNLVHFIKDNDWDYEKLEEVLKIAVRMLDNVNDLTYVPLETQRDSLKDRRRMGIGVLGYASALLMMKIKYGSVKGNEITNKLMKYIANTVYKESALLAKEKGPFKLFDKEKYLQSEFVKTLDEGTREYISKYGIRNSHLLSIQPTGHSSVFANLVSGGFEPMFSTGYWRTMIQHHPPKGLELPIVDWKTKSSSGDWKWIKEGDENLLAIEFEGKKYKFDKNRGLLKEEWIEDYGVTYLKSIEQWNENADWAKCSMELSVDDHVNVMAIFAKSVDAAISKTVNLKNDYPYEDFKNVYLKAWKNGVKGFTTYREGTMTVVLAKKSSTDNSKRPSELPCELHHLSVKGEKFWVVVGLNGGTPYEVFAGRGHIDAETALGKIIKVARPKGYKAVFDDDFVISPLTIGCNDSEQALLRMLSTSLRHGIQIIHIVEQLEKSTGDMSSFARAIARTLKKYIPDGETEEKCPNCDGKLKFQEGCKSCASGCGFSKCS